MGERLGLPYSSVACEASLRQPKELELRTEDSWYSCQGPEMRTHEEFSLIPLRC